MSIAISHNMDNITSIQQADLAKYMGLTKSSTNGNDPDMDASESKKMTVGAGNDITYKYRRGGVTLQAVIDVATQTMTWTVDGVQNQTNRHTALREGLKLAQDADLTDATIAW